MLEVEVADSEAGPKCMVELEKGRNRRWKRDVMVGKVMRRARRSRN